MDLILYLTGKVNLSEWQTISVLLLSVLGFLLAIYKHLIPPSPGYFNCDDPTIALPYKGDTFSTKILIAITLAIFLVLVSL